LWAYFIQDIFSEREGLETGEEGMASSERLQQVRAFLSTRQKKHKLLKDEDGCQHDSPVAKHNRDQG